MCADKNNDRFLTCLDACDTIILLDGMDAKSIIMNSQGLFDAYVTVLSTRFDDVPDYMVRPLAELKCAINNIFGVGTHENFSGGPGATLLNV